MMECHKCMKMGGALLLIVGILFLLQDLKIWAFWNLNWYTVAFLLMGIMKMSHCHCPECKKMHK